MRLFILHVLSAGLLGCNSEVKLKAPPVEVSGKVSQGGKPFGGAVMIFHPLGDGHVRELPIHQDGTFNGQLVSGEYAYYIAKPTLLGAAHARTKLSPKYFEADLSRTVTVEPGKELAIVLN